MQALRKIQKAITELKYSITSHCNTEMSDDNLASYDIEHIILSGRIIKKYTNDPRGTRYKIYGETFDGRKAYVVCRFLSDGIVRIITVYVE